MSIYGPYELTEALRSELRYFKDHNEGCAADEDHDDREGFAEVARVLGLVLDGRTLTEQERKTFCEELNERDYVTEDDRKLDREWMDLRAQAGDLEEFEPKTEYMPRPRTKVIRGKRYIVGYYRI